MTTYSYITPMCQRSCTNDSFLVNPNANFLVPKMAIQTGRLATRRNRVNGSSMIWKRCQLRAVRLCTNLYLCDVTVAYVYRVEEINPHHFDSEVGCWSTRTPAIRAGLNDRSQSAYAAPAPKPVVRAMGHARPRYYSKFVMMGQINGGARVVTHGGKG